MLSLRSDVRAQSTTVPSDLYSAIAASNQSEPPMALYSQPTTVPAGKYIWLVLRKPPTQLLAAQQPPAVGTKGGDERRS